MKNILKPIFEMITGEYILFNDILWNYIAIGIIGIISFAVAWNTVGKLYNFGIIAGKTSGSVIHWIIRLIIFIGVFYICNAIIWLTKFIYTYRFIVFIVLGVISFSIIIYKSLKKKSLLLIKKTRRTENRR